MTAAARLNVLRLGASRFIASTDAPPMAIMPKPGNTFHMEICISVPENVYNAAGEADDTDV